MHGHLGGLPPVVDLGAELKLAALIGAGGEQSLVASAHDLADGGLAQALAEAVMRFGIGARVWITEILDRDSVDATAALLSESTARMLVSVPREDDVRFQGLCEGRNFPYLRIGVTDDSGVLEVQDEFTIPLSELRGAHRATMAERFGAVIGQ